MSSIKKQKSPIEGGREGDEKYQFFTLKKFVPINKPNAQKNGPLVQMKEEMKNTSPNFKEKPRMREKNSTKMGSLELKLYLPEKAQFRIPKYQIPACHQEENKKILVFKLKRILINKITAQKWISWS